MYTMKMTNENKDKYTATKVRKDLMVMCICVRFTNCISYTFMHKSDSILFFITKKKHPRYNNINNLLTKKKTTARKQQYNIILLC